MPKLIPGHADGNYIHYCPGCDGLHEINTKYRNARGGQWSFNGDQEKPSFSPSVNIHPETPAIRCHYFITSGTIQYCADSHHDLRGKSVPLPEIPPEFI